MKNKKIFIIIFLTITLLASNYCFAYDASSSYIWSLDTETTQVSSSISSETSSTVEDNNSLNLESGSAILIEQSTGQVLYSHNAHEQLRPASVTKVMSILLIMEALDSGKITLDTQIPCSSNAASMGRFSNMVRYNRNFKC